MTEYQRLELTDALKEIAHAARVNFTRAYSMIRGSSLAKFEEGQIVETEEITFHHEATRVAIVFSHTMYERCFRRIIKARTRHLPCVLSEADVDKLLDTSQTTFSREALSRLRLLGAEVPDKLESRYANAIDWLCARSNEIQATGDFDKAEGKYKLNALSSDTAAASITMTLGFILEAIVIAVPDDYPDSERVFIDIAVQPELDRIRGIQTWDKETE